MNKKIIWGIVIIIVSLFYIFRDAIPESIWKYLFNYQVLIMLIGLYLVIQKRKVGWGLFGVGVYLYLSTFFEQYFNLGLPAAALIGGIGLIAMGIHEKNGSKIKDRRKETAVFKSSSKNKNDSDNSEEIEDAQEIK